MRDQLNKGEHLSTPLKQKRKSFFQGGETKRMKTRKILASLLAFAMLLSIVAVPAGSADAYSTNSVDRVVKVAKDHKFTKASESVYLRIEERNIGEFRKFEVSSGGAIGGGIIGLSLSNAKFNKAAYDKDTNSGAYEAAGFAPSKVGNQILLKLTEANATVKPVADEKGVWFIPLLADVSGEGEVTVTVDGRESFVSHSTHTFAVSAEGGSIASISEVKKFSDPKVTLGDIILEETRVGSLGASNTLRLRLPSSAFEWDTNSFKGGWTYTTGTTGTISFADVTGHGDRILEIKLPATNSVTYRDVLVLEGLAIKASSDAKFGDVVVRITGSDNITEQELTIAHYQDYGVVVKVADEDLPELYSGRWGDYPTKTQDKPDSLDTVAPVDTFKYEIEDVEETTYKETHNSAGSLLAEARELELATSAGVTEKTNKLAKLIIEENTAGAWSAQRRTRIEFPNEVKIIGVEATASNFMPSKLFTGTDPDFETFNRAQNALNRAKLGKNFIEFYGDEFRTETNKKAKVEIRFYVSVQAGFEGDIIAAVSGQSLGETTELVLGKATNPVKVEAEPVDLRIGVINQPLGDIVITEVDRGVIIENQPLVVTLPSQYAEGILWNKKPTVTVEEGDLELDEKNIRTSGNQLIIPIKADSTKASQIKITGGTVDLDRTVPEGVFSINVRGTALVQNDGARVDLDYGAFTTKDVASFKSLNVITPAPGEERRTVKFNLDSKEYTVIEAGVEVTKTMDVAPYNDNGRALLPIRFVAEALGVHEDNIVWNANIKEVTIFKGDRVTKVAIGSNVLVVNGTEVVMDTAAAIKDGRTVLPIRFVGQALGANIGWDDATRTITVQQ